MSITPDAVLAVTEDPGVDAALEDAPAEGVDRPHRHADVEVVPVPAVVPSPA